MRFIIPIFLCLSSLTWAQQQLFTEIPMFTNGAGGYACYRIPAVIRAPNGDLLAFAEGRVTGCNDFGNVDIVLRRSQDNGITWTTQELVADFGDLQAGNPAPVADLFDPRHPGGLIYLFYNTGLASEHETREGKGLREVWYKTSADNGKSWSEPVNITRFVHRPNRPDLNPDYQFEEDWRSYALTPGHALQLTRGAYRGRLFIPANHSQGIPQPGFNDYRAHAFYSDDHGKTWQLSNPVEVASSNESIAAELPEGHVMQNIRQQNGEKRDRLVAISRDGGESWAEVFFDSQLPSPVCQASLLNGITPAGQEVLLFSNPASREKRERMTVRVSFDNGRTWAPSRIVREGESAYSDLVQQSDGLIGLLYERGNDGGIQYAKFNFDWLLHGTNNQDQPYISKFTENTGFSSGSHFQLADPVLEFDRVFFSDPTEVRIRKPFADSVVRYTLDGTDPTETSSRYEGPVVVKNSCEIRAKAYHDTCRPSDVVSARFFKTGPAVPVKEIQLHTPPHANYPGTGAKGLVDLVKGSSNFRETAWMGFSGTDIEARIEFNEAFSFHKITACMLSDPGSWIFLPASMQVFVSEDGKEYYQVIQYNLTAPEPDQPVGMQYLEAVFEPQKCRFVKVLLKNIPGIPEWHPGKGTPAWLFIDELLIE